MSKKKKSLALTDFELIRPSFESSQEQTLEWLAKAHAKAQGEASSYDAFKNRLFRLGLGSDKIQRRGHVTADCSHENWHDMEVSRLNEKSEGVCLRRRMEIYDRIVSDVFEQFYRGKKLPNHIIHATCTGYISPSGAQKIAKYGNETVVTHAYHMGCYASIPSIRIGLHIENTDIVHTELCTLHINPTLHETSQLVVQTLFADGFIKYSLKENSPGLNIVALHEELIPDSMEAMTWGCESWGFKMTLAKELPVLIARALVPFLKRLLSKAGIPIWESAFFAIHPGGPKIIEQVAEALKLGAWQIEHSLKILQSYGNMSSATLPHIWDLMLKDQNITDKSVIISLAFGPGLTLCGGVFERRC